MGINANLSPDLRDHRIKKQAGSGYFVASPTGEKISGFYCNPERALTRLESILRQAQPRRIRACLCCGGNFKSEGNHNRMCDTCRHIHDGGLF